MALAESLAKHQDRDNQLLRDQLITKYLPNVKRIVYRIASHLPATVDVEDLINVGVIGLIQAIDRYDPTRDNKFLTYAVFRIKGAVLSELRSRDFLSRSNRKKIRDLERAYIRLEHKFGRDVDDSEVAEEMGISLEQLDDIKRMSNISFVNYEEIGYRSENQRENLMSFLFKGRSDDALSLTRLKELRAGLARAIEELPEKEKLVVSLYYLEELTMKEAGSVLGLTESRVSQIHSQAIIHLRAKLRKMNLLDD